MEQKITITEAIAKRKSVRDYDMTPLANEDVQQILDYAESIEPLINGAKTKIRLIGPNDVKSIRSWRAPHYLAIYAEESDNALLNVGYIFEQLTVYLTSLGLGTCWATSVSPKNAKEYEGLKWAATIAFGRKKSGQLWRENLSEAKRWALESVTDEVDEKLEIARIAPSAMNNQPWYFVHDGEKIRVYCVVQGFMKKWMSGMNRIDIGIALSHFKLKYATFQFEIEMAPTELKGYTYIGTVTL